MPTVHDALEAGAIAPGFRLPSNTGDVDIADYRGKKGVVLYFIREFGCMTCQYHASTLVKAYAEIQGTGFEILVIGGGSTADAVKMAQRLKIPFPVLADGDRSVYGKYNVVKAFAVIQKSATFVVDLDGKVVYAHRSTSPSGGLNLGEVMAVVRKMAPASPTTEVMG